MEQSALIPARAVAVVGRAVSVSPASRASFHRRTRSRSTASSNWSSGRLPHAASGFCARSRASRQPTAPRSRSAPTTTRNGWSAASAPGCRPSSTTTLLSWSMVPIRSSTSSSALPAIPPLPTCARSLRQVSICCAGGLPRSRAAPLRSSPRIPASRAGAPRSSSSSPAGRRSSRRWRSAPRPISRSATTGRHRVFRQIYRREHVARHQQPAAAAGPAPDRRSGTGRRAAGREHRRPAGGRHNAPGVDADPAWRRDHGQRAAVHRRRGRRLRAARRPDDPLYAAGDGSDHGRRDAAAPPRFA